MKRLDQYCDKSARVRLWGIIEDGYGFTYA
jgi:hypothetical protein